MMEKTETQRQRDEERQRQEFQLMLKNILVETIKKETERREQLEMFHKDMERKHLAETEQDIECQEEKEADLVREEARHQKKDDELKKEEAAREKRHQADRLIETFPRLRKETTWRLLSATFKIYQKKKKCRRVHGCFT